MVFLFFCFMFLPLQGQDSLHFELQTLQIEDRHVRQLNNQLEADAIQNSTSGNFAEQMSELSGVQVLRNGNSTQVSVRGFSGSRVLLLQGGIAQQEQQWGADHGHLLSQSSLEQVEFIKGAETILYGGNAIGGALHLKPSVIFQRDTLSVFSALQWHSNNNLISLQERLQWKKNKTQWQAGFFTAHSQNLRIPQKTWQYRNRSYAIDNELANTAFTAYHGNWSMAQVLKNGLWRVLGTWVHEKTGIFPLQVFSQYPEHSYKIGSPYMQSQHQKLSSEYHKHFGALDFMWDIGMQRNERLEREPYGIAHKLNLFDVQNQIKLGIPLDRHEFVVGIQNQVQAQNRAGAEFLAPAYFATKQAVFALGKFSLQNGINLQSGARLEYLHYQSKAYQNFAEALQRNLLGYAITLSLDKQFEHTRLELSLGKNYRFPEAIEWSANGVHHGAFRYEKGDASLKAEENIHLDFALAQTWRYFSWQISPYLNYFWHYIFLRPTGVFAPSVGSGQIYQYTGRPVLNTGLELNTSVFPWDFLSWDFAGDYVFFYNLREEVGVAFSPVPRLKNTLDFHFVQKKVKFGIKLSHQYKFQTLYLDKNEKFTSAYQLLSAQAHCKVAMKKQSLNFLLGVENMLNTRYQDALSNYKALNLAEKGRNVVLQVQFGI
jgi:iron complex outermembrane receptor protein